MTWKYIYGHVDSDDSLGTNASPYEEGGLPPASAETLAAALATVAAALSRNGRGPLLFRDEYTHSTCFRQHSMHGRTPSPRHFWCCLRQLSHACAE